MVKDNMTSILTGADGTRRYVAELHKGLVGKLLLTSQLILERNEQ
jgi:hypothetical protein